MAFIKAFVKNFGTSQQKLWRKMKKLIYGKNSKLAYTFSIL